MGSRTYTSPHIQEKLKYQLTMQKSSRPHIHKTSGQRYQGEEKKMLENITISRVNNKETQSESSE